VTPPFRFSPRQNQPFPLLSFFFLRLVSDPGRLICGFFPYGFSQTLPRGLLKHPFDFCFRIEEFLVCCMQPPQWVLKSPSNFHFCSPEMICLFSLEYPFHSLTAAFSFPFRLLSKRPCIILKLKGFPFCFCLSDGRGVVVDFVAPARADWSRRGGCLFWVS